MALRPRELGGSFSRLYGFNKSVRAIAMQNLRFLRKYASVHSPTRVVGPFLQNGQAEVPETESGAHSDLSCSDKPGIARDGNVKISAVNLPSEEVMHMTG